MFLLHFLRWLRTAQVEIEFEILLGKGGPLEADFAETGRVLHRSELRTHSNALAHYDLIYANTCLCGEIIDSIGIGDVPVVTHLHELDCGYQWTGAHRIARMLRHTTRFVACARAVARSFSHRFDVPVERIAVHYEMIDATLARRRAVARDEAGLRTRFQLPAEAFIVIGCGTIDLRKGVDVFARAAQQLRELAGADRDIRFVWIGGGKDAGMRFTLRSDAEKLGLGDALIFAGELADPHALLSLGNVFWMTSREDPFPLAMLEAAALTLPVLCFDRAGGGPEFCELGGGRVVPYLDTAALARETYDLMQDPEGAQAIGMRAAALVDERYHIDAIGPVLWEDLKQWLRDAPDKATIARQRTQTLTQIMAAWSPDKAPNPEFVAAHLERQKMRAKAQALIRQGRKILAVQILVEAAKAAKDADDAWIYCDGMTQVGHDLRTIDPVNSRQLLANAAQVAERIGVDPVTFIQPTPPPTIEQRVPSVA